VPDLAAERSPMRRGLKPIPFIAETAT